MHLIEFTFIMGMYNVMAQYVLVYMTDQDREETIMFIRFQTRTNEIKRTYLSFFYIENTKIYFKTIIEMYLFYVSVFIFLNKYFYFCFFYHDTRPI
jgi:hypothetical protein